MKKRYAYRMKPWLYVLGAAVIIISSACIVVNSLRLAGVGELISPDPALDGVSIGVLSLVAVVMAATLFGSGYSISKKGVVRNIGFFFAVMPWDDIVLVRYDEQKTILLVYYRVDKGGYLKDEMSGLQARFERVVIAPKHYDDFAAVVHKRSPKAEIEVVKKEDENEQ